MTYDDLYALLPCIMLGFLCGVISIFKSYYEHDKNFDEKKLNNIERAFRFFAICLSSSLTAFIVFLLLDFSNLTYMTKLGISALVAFFGIENAIAYAEKFFGFVKRN